VSFLPNMSLRKQGAGIQEPHDGSPLRNSSYFVVLVATSMIDPCPSREGQGSEATRSYVRWIPCQARNDILYSDYGETTLVLNIVRQ